MNNNSLKMGTAWDLFLKPPLFHCLWWLNLCKEVSVADEPSWYSVLGGLTHQTPLPGLHTTWTTRESCKDSSLPNELPGQLFSCVLSWNNKNTPSFCQPSRSVWDGNIRLRSTCSAVSIFHNHKSSSAKPAFFTETPPSIRSVPKASHSLHPVPFLLCPPPPPRPLHLQTLHIFVCVCVYAHMFQCDQTAGLCPAWHSLHICVENPQRGRCGLILDRGKRQCVKNRDGGAVTLDLECNLSKHVAPCQPGPSQRMLQVFGFFCFFKFKEF